MNLTAETLTQVQGTPSTKGHHPQGRNSQWTRREVSCQVRTIYLGLIRFHFPGFLGKNKTNAQKQASLGDVVIVASSIPAVSSQTSGPLHSIPVLLFSFVSFLSFLSTSYTLLFSSSSLWNMGNKGQQTGNLKGKLHYSYLTLLRKTCLACSFVISSINYRSFLKP